MKVGDLVKVQYRFDWVEIGIVTVIMQHNQAKIHWSNTGRTSVVDTQHLHSSLEVISESR